MVSFIDTFQQAWKTPEVDMSEPLSSEELIEILQLTLYEGSLARAQQIDAILETYGWETYTTLDGYTFTLKNRTITKDGKDYQLSNLNGILTLEEIFTKNQIKPDHKRTGLVLFDNSDADDYNTRYASIDARVYSESGADIAFLKIIDKNRQAIFPAFDESPAPGITKNKFKQFILMQSSIQHQERMQIVETNASYQALFFGSKPEVLQIAGLLKNTVDNPWTINMIFLWDELMRGTALVEKGYICQLFVDGELFEGYPFNFSRSKVAGNDYVTNFNFSFLIRSRSVVNKVDISYNSEGVS